MDHALLKEARSKMEKSLENFHVELSGIRTGRASVGLLDGIEVDAYGQMMKLNQVGTVSAPEARMLMVTPWDKGQIAAIEKAIIASPLNLTPSNDGNVIRIPLPELTEERRKDLVKVVSKMAEDNRISIRNIRRHAVDEAKKAQKDGDLPEDEAHRLTADVQKATDEYIGKIDDFLKTKEAEIMEV